MKTKALISCTVTAQILTVSCSKQAAAVCSKQAATVCSKQAATKSEKSNLHMKNAQATRLQQTMSRKVAATKSSKTNLHTKNSQAASMPQLAAAAKPHACCLFAAIHCEKPFISIRVSIMCSEGMEFQPGRDFLSRGCTYPTKTDPCWILFHFFSVVRGCNECTKFYFKFAFFSLD